MSRSSLTGWKVLRHPDSERHVSSYTTLVPDRQGIGHSCSECVSGLLAALLLDGCPLLVGRLVSAGDDVGEILRRARALVKVRHVVCERVCEVVGGRSDGVEGVLGDGIVRVLVLLGLAGITAEMRDAFELARVSSIKEVALDNGQVGHRRPVLRAGIM